VHALDLVRNAFPLPQQVARHRSVPVKSTKRNGFAHLTHSSSTLGKYDAQMGEEVVTKRRRAGIGLAVLVVAVATGCESSPKRAERGSQAQVRHCRQGTVRSLGSGSLAYAAVVRMSARAYRRPGSRPLARFRHDNVNGVPTVFAVRAAVLRRNCRAAWYRVQLPIKPNGRTGYVRAPALRVQAVPTRVVVDISDRRLTLYERGRVVLRAAVAVGSVATPTPTGRYYVNQRLIPADTSGPFGPGAVGISAFSNVLTGWAQGGPVAIHGTNEPWSIGHAASNGCIRLPNDTLRKVFALARAGTPVIIRA
jgi:lipoprotein-anchoring transpeptidase ErfK/SrfK